MKYIFLVNLLIVSCCFRAQQYSYLNASTGNPGEYIVDADTNMFIYSADRIEKLDKNFAAVWVNTYSGLTFKNLLLSKTGSLFFVAGSTNTSDRIGKIDRNGNLSWCKTLGTTTVSIASATYTLDQMTANNLLLNRNNQLVVAGTSLGNVQNAFMYKMDTSGNFISARIFGSPITQATNVTVINDSAGYYSIGIAFIQVGVGPMGSLIKYNETAKTFKYASLCYHEVHGFLKSKSNPFNFYHYTQQASYPNFRITRFNKSNRKWIFDLAPQQYKELKNLDEDKNGNLFVTMGNLPNYSNTYNSWVLKLDSNGTNNSTVTDFISNYYDQTGSYHSNLRARLTVLPGPNHVFSVARLQDTSIQMSLIDTSLVSACYNTSVINATLTPTSDVSALNGANQTFSITPYVLPVVGSTVTVIPNLLVHVNNCIVLKDKEYGVSMDGIRIYPNPAKNILELVGEEINAFESTIFDSRGNVVETSNAESIDISRLNPGLYFIKIKSGEGEFSQKFIKE